MVLGAVCEAIKEKVDAQEEEAPGVISLDGRGRFRVFFCGCGVVVEGKHCNARGDKGNDDVFVERVRTAEESDL